MSQKKQYGETINANQKKHTLDNPLRFIILGGQDGLVNALGIVLGVSSASTDTRIILAAVVAAACAESISMGAVAYTSALAHKDYYFSQRRRRAKQIQDNPKFEKENLALIYKRKGFIGDVLDQIIKTITANKNIWLDVIMAEELHLEKPNMRVILKSAYLVALATGIGHMTVALPFFFLNQRTALFCSLVLSVITLFAVGVYQAKTLDGIWWKSGLRLVIIGITAAAIGYIIATLLHASNL